jgi:hypothetical protein
VELLEGEGHFDAGSLWVRTVGALGKGLFDLAAAISVSVEMIFFFLSLVAAYPKLGGGHISVFFDHSAFLAKTFRIRGPYRNNLPFNTRVAVAVLAVLVRHIPDLAHFTFHLAKMDAILFTSRPGLLISHDIDAAIALAHCFPGSVTLLLHGSERALDRMVTVTDMVKAQIFWSFYQRVCSDFSWLGEGVHVCSFGVELAALAVARAVPADTVFSDLLHSVAAGRAASLASQLFTTVVRVIAHQQLHDPDLEVHGTLPSLTNSFLRALPGQAPPPPLSLAEYISITALPKQIRTLFARPLLAGVVKAQRGISAALYLFVRNAVLLSLSGAGTPTFAMRFAALARRGEDRGLLSLFSAILSRAFNFSQTPLVPDQEPVPHLHPPVYLKRPIVVTLGEGAQGVGSWFQASLAALPGLLLSFAHKFFTRNALLIADAATAFERFQFKSTYAGVSDRGALFADSLATYLAVQAEMFWAPRIASKLRVSANGGVDKGAASQEWGGVSALAADLRFDPRHVGDRLHDRADELGLLPVEGVIEQIYSDPVLRARALRHIARNDPSSSHYKLLFLLFADTEVTVSMVPVSAALIDFFYPGWFHEIQLAQPLRTVAYIWVPSPNDISRMFVFVWRRNTYIGSKIHMLRNLKK